MRVQDNDLGQAAVPLLELESKREHAYTVALGETIEGSGEVSFSATFEPLPPNEGALRAAYEATGRVVPV